VGPGLAGTKPVAAGAESSVPGCTSAPASGGLRSEVGPAGLMEDRPPGDASTGTLDSFVPAWHAKVKALDADVRERGTGALVGNTLGRAGWRPVSTDPAGAHVE